MSMIVNTNVSSLTAQRSLAESSRMLDTAMERLATGSKINSASDDAAGLAIVQRMTSQIQGLQMAVKNANDGISMTQSIEGALVEVTDMLQRLRELAVQAANSTNTDVDRSYIQEEVNLLVAEISRISTNTRYNGQHVLNGTFSNVQLQVGTEGGEVINFTVDSTAADQLGAYKVTGDRIEANAASTGAGAYVNPVGNGDDIIINGNTVSRTIDVAQDDSAKTVAEKINLVTGETKVTAQAKTYAHVYSEYATDETYSIKINEVTTGTFAISRSNVADAVDKINAISGATNVLAEATSDNKVRLYSSDGRDVLVENESTGTNLRVQSVGHDGVATMPQKAWHLGVATTAGSTSDMVANGTFTLVQRSTGQTWSFAVGEGNARTIADLEADLNGIDGAGGGFDVKANSSLANSPLVTATEDFGDFDIYSGTDIQVAANLQTFVGQGAKVTYDGDNAGLNPASAGASIGLTLSNLTTGSSYAFTVTSASASGPTAAEMKTGLDAIDGVGVFTISAAAAADADGIIYGPADFGNWTILSSAGAAIGTAVTTAGDLNLLDRALEAAGSNDAVTVQGTVELTSSKSFSVTQSDEASGAVTDPLVATGSLGNDNYFVTRAATLDSVSNVNLRTTAGAGAAIKTLDGAIEKISSARAELGAIENRLEHTVSNLMNVAENTAHSRSQIKDTDFSVESANLAKAQVLQQAGTAMLAQANARSQLVLQLLQ